MHGCFVALRRHEEQQLGGSRVTHVIRARPDLYWLAPLPPLASLDRQRVMLYAHAPSSMHSRQSYLKRP